MKVRGPILAAAVVAATVCTHGGAHATVLELVKRACLDEPLPYGRKAESTLPGERSFELSPGDPEYDASIALIPAPPAGWSGDFTKTEVFSSDALGCGFRVLRIHRQGERDLIFSLTFASAVKEMQDDLAKAKPDITPPERLFEFKGRKGYDRIATPDQNLVLVVGSMALSIDGTATEAEKRALLDAVDLDAIERFRF